jgi:hypothetical protein
MGHQILTVELTFHRVKAVGPGFVCPKVSLQQVLQQRIGQNDEAEFRTDISSGKFTYDLKPCTLSVSVAPDIAVYSPPLQDGTNLGGLKHVRVVAKGIDESFEGDDLESKFKVVHKRGLSTWEVWYFEGAT